MFFPYLNDEEVISLLSDTEVQTLNYEEFNNITYSFLNSSNDSHDLLSCYPETNHLHNVTLPKSSYYNHQDFESLLTNNSLPMITLYNINSIPHNFILIF